MIEESFSDYGIDAPNSGTGEYRTRCPHCEESHHQRGQKDLSVNLDAGTWYCHRCHWTGGLKTDQAFTAERTQPVPKRRETHLKGILEPCQHENNGPKETTAQAEYHALPPLSDAALMFLKSRGISQDTAELAGIKSANRYSHRAGKEVECVAFPVLIGGECVNIKYRPLELKDFSQTKGGDQTALFCGDALQDAETIVFTEGEFDALAVMEAGYPIATSAPNGAPPPNARDTERKLSFIDANREAFDRGGRVLLAMDKDTPGLAFEKLVAAAIGPEKCFSVDYPQGCKDANEVLVKFGKTALVAALDHAKPYPVPGITVFSEHAAEIEKYWETRGRENLFSTGFPMLDNLYKLQLGTLNIVTGIPSHGKSEFLDQIAIKSMRLHGWKWAIFSPENYPIANHFSKLAEKWTGKPFFTPSENVRWSIPALTRDEMKQAIAELSKQVQILTAGDDAGDDLDGILARLETCIRRDKVNAVILDPWNEIEHKRPENLTETEYISLALSKCRNFARRFNIMFFIVAHPTKLMREKDGTYPVPTPWDISGSAHWRNKADCCLCVWRDTGKNTPDVVVYVQKMRNKTAGRTGISTMEWIRANGCYQEKNFCYEYE